ncbi:hypothetical protein ACN20G_21725 [Streptomyces sp. BI20]
MTLEPPVLGPPPALERATAGTRDDHGTRLSTVVVRGDYFARC